jgi:hypothetical protein
LVVRLITLSAFSGVETSKRTYHQNHYCYGYRSRR